MKKRNATEWLKLFEEHRVSGLSAAEFCRRNGLNPKYFSLRRRELSSDKPAFIEVTASPSSLPVKVRVTEFQVPLAELGSVLASLR